MCNLCSENKGADQLQGYCAADLCLCFRIYAKSRFSHDMAQMIMSENVNIQSKDQTIISLLPSLKWVTIMVLNFQTDASNSAIWVHTVCYFSYVFSCKFECVCVNPMVEPALYKSGYLFTVVSVFRSFLLSETQGILLYMLFTS